MKEINPKAYYDVVIIGGGISGLTSSALLSKAGLSCCVFEMNENVGGYMVGFDRKGYKFDTAIHWLNDCGQKGFVSKIFKIIDKNYPKAETQKEIRRFVTGNSDYLLTNNPEKLKEKLIAKFPDDGKGIKRFFRDAKRISKSFEDYINLGRSVETRSLFGKMIYGLKMLKFAFAFIRHIKYSGDEGVEKGLKKYSKSQELQNIFGAEDDLLSCLVPVAWAYSDNFQTPPKGGSRAYTQWLYDKTKERGGEIFLNSKVTEVIIENNKVTGVKIQTKAVIKETKCKYIIAASDAGELFNKLLPQNTVSEKKKNNLEKAKLYTSAVTVSVALNCPAEKLGIGKENIYFFDASVSRKDLSGGDPHKSGIHISAPSLRDKTLSPEGKGTMNIFIPAYIQQNNFWQCEKDADGKFIRGKAYKELKSEFAEILINRIQEKLIPDLKEHILFYDVATPITYYRYTLNKNGTMMGQRPGKENIMNKVASYKTPVKNLLQSGHWADLGGGVPVAVKSALNTSLIILKKENKKVFKQFADYVDGKIEN
ncbi:MAG: NAD(P)/FAD-dependent oxidoreductase [Chlorobi bacterium]|nr:NAD(P)/FAD-dependent oxidoreductase [Chlorobiota bacterium]